MGRLISGAPARKTESVRISADLLHLIRKEAAAKGYILTRRIEAYIEAGMKKLGDA